MSIEDQSLFAVISDLHSNLPALEAVFRRIDELGITDVRCLGDVVGYGADPEACLDLIRERARFSLCGNHDWGVIESGLDEFNPLARESLEWTRRQLKPGFFSRAKRSRWNYMRDMPRRVELDGMIFVHASPRDPIREYVLKSDVFLEPEKMEALFACISGPCFNGHTHWPGIMTEDFRFQQQTPDCLDFDLPPGKSIINVGSVGQPRDSDTRACFLVVDGNQLRYQRVEYDIEEAQRRIHAAGLSPYLADRLGLGR